MIKVKRVRAIALAGILAVGLGGAPAQAEDDPAAEAGLGAGAAIATLVYGPLKVVYSTLGLIFGGVAWGLSGGDSEVRDAVISPAIRGDYVVTPAHLRGERPLEFFGREPAYRSTPPAAVSGAPYGEPVEPYSRY